MLKKIKVKSVIGAIFNDNQSKILLLQRKDVPVWVLPGGGIDEGETAEEAIIREILEETGFTVKIEKIVGLYLPLNRLAKPTLVYLLKIQSGELKNSYESRSVQFFPINNLPKLIPPPFLEWIHHSTLKKPFKIQFLRKINYLNFFRYFITNPWLSLRFILARLGLPLNI